MNKKLALVFRDQEEYRLVSYSSVRTTTISPTPCMCVYYTLGDWHRGSVEPHQHPICLIFFVRCVIIPSWLAPAVKRNNKDRGKTFQAKRLVLMAMTMYNEEKRRPRKQQRGEIYVNDVKNGMDRIRTLYSVNSGSFAAVCLALLLDRVTQFRIQRKNWLLLRRVPQTQIQRR